MNVSKANARGPYQRLVMAAVLIWLTGANATTWAVEPWGDARLKLTSGLTAWYDASVQNAARAAIGKKPWKDDARVDVWRDASGARRDLLQPTKELRPVIRFDEQLAFVHFNGETSVLAVENLDISLGDFTVFVVAAPFSNDGTFRGFLAFNRNGQNDYVSGLNIDQGPDGSPKFATINVEGPGFGGASNLKKTPTPFGELARICVASTPGAGGTVLYDDGKPVGQRDRAPGTVQMDRLTVGARYFNNGGAPQADGYLRGEIAEVLIYDRRLSGAELEQVDDYLVAKYGVHRTRPVPLDLIAARPIPKVEVAPPVQMLVPGFATREVPLELPNINSIRYRPDGKVMALSYDGHLHLLSDTNGDGLEDKVEPFWDQPGITAPIGMALTPPGYALGQGAFIAARGQVVLVVDTNGDNRGDQLIKVADGWEPIKPVTDTLGVAIGPDGSVYYGTGTQEYANGYQLDAEGKAHYVPGTERGAIVKVSPDFKTREPICSGIRFTVALAFNREGDLFCSEQEGATWLPNGNPFDELLHIETGRHYGFPPRHPQHLPNVLDEPSVYDYTPQHQSTCGLTFNLPAIAGGPVFGPAWWQDNAIVCGYSRGKLYRTTLTKTSHGYVADNALIGCLNMLTIDACNTPAGDLLVAMHSGGPDWGSGPSGKGKLYKVSYVDRKAPQPVRAWAATPHEVHVAFDRPLSDEDFESYRRAKLEYGQAVRAGDRFELFWPGYAVVDRQNRAPRRLLPVLGVSLTADRRSVVLSTGPHREALGYAVLFESNTKAKPLADTLPQFSAVKESYDLTGVELSYDLSGVEAHWESEDGTSSWQSWLPHLEVAAAKELLVGTAESERLAQLVSRPGKLTLKTQLNLSHMLRPVVQPGSKLDAEFPPEDVTVVLGSSSPLVLKAGGVEHRSEPTTAGRYRTTWTVSQVGEAWQPVEIVVPTGTGSTLLTVSWSTAEDSRQRAFAQRRFMLPWAQPAGAVPANQETPELAGGDWHRGRDVFYGEQAQCGKCHAVQGRGGWIGPDLSNLVHRDYASVLRDITLPSFAINPDHGAVNVLLDDGRVLTGRVRPNGDSLRIGDIKGVETEVPRASVEEMRPAQLSLMPEGLPKAIGPAGIRDLMTFLLLAEPGVLEPAPIEQPGAPPPRTRAEVGELLRDAKPVDVETLKPLNIVLVSGPKDHGPGEHDYPAWQSRWTQLLTRSPLVTVDKADPWPSAEQWKTADVVVMFSANPAWTPERAKELDAFFARGGGLVLLHFAVNGQRAPEEYARRIGLACNPSTTKFRHGELNLDFRMPNPHPITAGFSTLHLVDESYWNLVGDEKQINVLATQVEAGKPRPLLWTYQPGHGRVFVSILGHYSWTFDDPLFRLLVLRAMAWTADQPIDRFNTLVLPGTRISDSAVSSASGDPP